MAGPRPIGESTWVTGDTASKSARTLIPAS